MNAGKGKKKLARLTKSAVETSEEPTAEFNSNLPPASCFNVENSDLLNLVYNVIPMADAAVAPAAMATLYTLYLAQTADTQKDVHRVNTASIIMFLGYC